MRKKKLLANTATSLLYRLTAIICGLILPRIILGAFGSEVNGLVSSISQFLNIITLLELGVGSVVQSALYKPLANKDDNQISAIITSASKFFRNIAFILAGYVVFLLVFYPKLTVSSFDHVYTATLIGVISISYFAQYYFSVVDRLLLGADQKGYISYISHIVMLVLNTVFSVFLVRVGASIHIVKLVSSLVFFVRPIIFRIYIKKHYRINRHAKYDVEPIKQKWNGMAQHFAAVILSDADVIILTVMSTLSNVSIYTVYSMVTVNVKNIFISMTKGLQSLYGELWVKQEVAKLKNLFSVVEWVIHTAIVFIFGCSAVLIVPFVTVYTRNVSDANYISPAFGVLLVLAHAVHCMREPYNIMILAGNHYKQTQSNYIIAAIINIIVSVALVKFFGLIGVAIGTLVAMLFQTVWMAYYNSKNFIKWPLVKFLKQLFVDICSFVIAFFATSWIKLGDITFVAWILMAIKVALIWMAILLLINLLMYRNNMKLMLIMVVRRTAKQDGKSKIL